MLIYAAEIFRITNKQAEKVFNLSIFVAHFHLTQTCLLKYYKIWSTIINNSNEFSYNIANYYIKQEVVARQAGRKHHF